MFLLIGGWCLLFLPHFRVEVYGIQVAQAKRRKVLVSAAVEFLLWLLRGDAAYGGRVTRTLHTHYRPGSIICTFSDILFFKNTRYIHNI